MVELTIGTKQLAKLQRTMQGIKDGVPKVLVPAINRALASGRTAVRREIRKEYLIKQKDIPIKVAKASHSTLGGSVTVAQGMLPLDKFKLRPKFNLASWYAGQTGVNITPHVHRKRKAKPIFAQVKKGGGGTLRGGFYIPQGGPYVRRGSSRLPIKRLVTIGASIMAAQPSVGPAASKAMGDTLDKRLDHEIRRVLAKGK